MRSLRRGRPATVPAGVRDPSRARPGPDRLGRSARSAPPRWPVRRGGRPAGRAARRRAGARAAGPAGAVARAAPALRARRAAAARRAGGERPQDAAQRAVRAAPGARPGRPRRAGGRRRAGRAARTRSASTCGSSAGCLADGELEAAAEAGHGELLDGFDGDWALRARDEHAAELAGVLGTLAARAEDAGDLPAAVAWARRRLDVEPLAEAAHRELIRLLALGGDRPAALAAARAMGERLRSELGIPPSAATRALVEDVRRGRIARPAAAAAAASAPPLPAALAAAEHPEGRGPALARLERAWADAVAGARRFALVTGEPGIGKTTLAGELARRAHAAGRRRAARAQRRARARALPAVDRGARAAPGRAAGRRRRPLADRARRGAGPPAAGAQRGAGRRRAARASATSRSSWCARCSTTSPRAGRSCSCSTTCTGPTRTRSPCCATSRGRRRAARLLVRALRAPGRARAGRRADARGAAARGPARPRRAGGPRRRRGGRAARAAHRRDRPRSPRGATARAAAATRSSSTSCCARRRRPAATPSGPPAGVRDVIARRLARLGDADAARARRGRRLRPRVRRRRPWPAWTDRPVVEVLEALDGATEAALVAADRSARALRVRPRARRRDDRRRAAGLAPRAAAPADRRRPRRSPRRRRGRAPARSSGTCAAPGALAGARAPGDAGSSPPPARPTAALAHADAAAHYEAALAARRGRRTPSAARCCSRWATPTTAPGGADRPAPRSPRPPSSPARRGDPELLARAALGHGGTAVVIAAADPDAVRLLEEALAAAPAGDPATSARLLARLSVELYYADPARARELSALAVERARRADDPAALAAALNARRVALWSPHHADERLAVAGDMLAAAEAAGDREAVLQARNWRVVDLLELGRVRGGGRGDRRLRGPRRRRRPAALPLVRAAVARHARAAGRAAGTRRASWPSGRSRSGARPTTRTPRSSSGSSASTCLYAQRRIDEIDRARLVEGARGLARRRRVARLPGAARRRDRRDGGRAPAGLRARPRRLQRPRDGRQLARRLRPGRRRRARRRPRGGRGAVRPARAARAAVPGHRPRGRRASAPTSTTSGASPACSGATTRPRPGCAARWPRTSAPAPGRTPPSRSLRLGEALAARGEPDAARDVLQQAASTGGRARHAGAGRRRPAAARRDRRLTGAPAPALRPSPGKTMPIWRRISSMTRIVATESASGRSGDSRRPSAMQRATSAASKCSASCAVALLAPRQRVLAAGGAQDEAAGLVEGPVEGERRPASRRSSRSWACR